MQQSFLYHQSNISYRVIGSGTPVLLMHGLGRWADLGQTD